MEVDGSNPVVEVVKGRGRGGRSDARGEVEVEGARLPRNLSTEDGVSKARLAARSAKGQGGCLLGEVVEISFPCRTRSWKPRLVQDGDERQPAFKDSSMMHVRA